MTTPPQEPSGSGSEPAPADQTVWMPGPDDPSSWESPVDDTGLFPAPDPDPFPGPQPEPDPFPVSANPFAPAVPPGFPGSEDATVVVPPFTDPSQAPTMAFSPVTGAPDPGFPEPELPTATETRYSAHEPASGSKDRPKWVPFAAVGAVAAVVIGIVAALMGGGDDPQPVAAPATTPAATPTTSAPVTTSATPTTTSASPTPTLDQRVELTSMGASDAVTWVRNAGAKPTGEVSDAWTYSDLNGTNVLLLTYEVKHRYPAHDDEAEPTVSGEASGTPSATPTEEEEAGDTSPNQATSRIYLVAAKDGEDPKILRTITDENGGLCENDFAADFAPDSVAARDTNGDGIAEVTVGWYSSCRGDPGPMEVNLALLSGPKKLLLHGYGLPADIDDLKMYRDDFGVEPVEFEATPRKSSWPKGAYEFALSVAKKAFV